MPDNKDNEKWLEKELYKTAWELNDCKAQNEALQQRMGILYLALQKIAHGGPPIVADPDNPNITMDLSVAMMEIAQEALIEAFGKPTP